ncbi:MAG: hypothetical protein G01um101425_493 [Candidatus Peregrinibacteria bacterium Gr01-1014_25]|nr:MAG: hypothetical protein G01um101425_493 [Candidatus Peregrinibacteria bacterium Gr01-1014_25]
MRPSLRSLRLSVIFLTVFSVGVAFGTAGTVVGRTLLGSSVFSDVAQGTFFDEAVGELYTSGIMVGSNGRFRPGDPLTRGEFAVALQRLRADLLGEDLSDDSSADEEEEEQEEQEETEASSSRSRPSSTKSATSSSSSSSVKAGPEGAFRFATETFTIPETAKGLTIGIVRAIGSKGNVGVSVELTGESAIEGEDYTKNNATLAFKDGETTKTFTILLKNDTLAEGQETVHVRLMNPTGGAVLGNPNEATMVILDDERGGNTGPAQASSASSVAASNAAAGTFALSAVGYGIKENGGNLTVTVNRTGGSTGEVGVTYTTEDGTGKNAQHYSKATGTLAFAAGETSKTFTVPIIDNGDIGGNKTFSIRLSAPTGGAGLSKYSLATATIYDNETADTGSGSFRLSKSDYAGAEGESLVVLVQRVGGTTGAATVTYATISGSASGNDFTPANGTLSFAAGEASKEMLVPLLTDGVSDGGETFSFVLSNAVGAGLSTPSSAVIRIDE